MPRRSPNDFLFQWSNLDPTTRETLLNWAPLLLSPMVLVFCSGDWAFWGPDHWTTGVIPEISNRKPVPVFFCWEKKNRFHQLKTATVKKSPAGIVPPKNPGLGFEDYFYTSFGSQSRKQGAIFASGSCPWPTKQWNANLVSRMTSNDLEHVANLVPVDLWTLRFAPALWSFFCRLESRWLATPMYWFIMTPY